MSGPQSPFDDSQAFQRALNAERIESLEEENRAKRAEARETRQAERRAERNKKLLSRLEIFLTIITVGLYPLCKVAARIGASVGLSAGRWCKNKWNAFRQKSEPHSTSATISTHGTGSTEQQPVILNPSSPAIVHQHEAAASKAPEVKRSWKDILPWNRAKKRV